MKSDYQRDINCPLDKLTQYEPEPYIPMALDYPIKSQTKPKKLLCLIKVNVTGLNK